MRRDLHLPRPWHLPAFRYHAPGLRGRGIRRRKTPDVRALPRCSWEPTRMRCAARRHPRPRTPRSATWYPGCSGRPTVRCRQMSTPSVPRTRPSRPRIPAPSSDPGRNATTESSRSGTWRPGGRARGRESNTTAGGAPAVSAGVCPTRPGRALRARRSHRSRPEEHRTAGGLRRLLSA